MDETELIVVGVDGSDPSRAALRWALIEAALRGARVEVVKVFDPHREWPEACGVPPLTVAEVTSRLEATTRDMVRSVVAELGPDLAGGAVEVVALVGAPGQVLVRQAQRADLLVVGHRGIGSHGLRGTRMGSVGLHCVLHATCPVTVVRPIRGRAGVAGERSADARPPALVDRAGLATNGAAILPATSGTVTIRRD
jgi:nucleotide-binding universal stress UspA family protein